MTAIFDGKHILGDPNEIKEVRNAYETYEMILDLDPASVQDLLKVHKIMINGLIPENGRFCSGGVGVFDEDIVAHMAPPAEFVPVQIQDLFDWYQHSEMHPLIKSAIFHYEFEFIHLFADGNGRMGRMWHSMLLGQWKELFYWLPVEELIRTRQKEYYDALGKSDKEADISAFVELILDIIADTLKQTEAVGNAKSTPPTQVEKLLAALDDETLSAFEMMERLGLSHRPMFRKNYLSPALEQNLIEMTIPDKPNSRNQKYHKR